ncbi:hypothetical protein [Mesorhizobium sp.]|uniref:hypothetical protein n=1 Tax=Mesorhizobium sp. TaxID=1871066 RepID=UPI001219A9B8|nr:hypothetical protein [Mesorhizobium sp.]TIT00221.1 MAG: hypothetical protein E5W87_19775 [Mesorhizobium sp.]
MPEIVRLLLWTIIPPAFAYLTYLALVIQEPCGLGNEGCVWIVGTTAFLAFIAVVLVTTINAFNLIGAAISLLMDRMK